MPPPPSPNSYPLRTLSHRPSPPLSHADDDAGPSSRPPTRYDSPKYGRAKGKKRLSDVDGEDRDENEGAALLRREDGEENDVSGGGRVGTACWSDIVSTETLRSRTR